MSILGAVFPVSYWRAQRGVRQGGILSDFFFSLYINEILEEISLMPYRCRLGICSINNQAYADDIVLFCPSPDGLRQLLIRFQELANEHELVLNIGKTKVVIFGQKLCESLGISFSICGVTIDIVQNYKYLGVIFDCILCEKDDVDRILKSFNRSVGMFLRKFHSVDFNVKIKLFDSLCMSLYGLDIVNSSMCTVSAFNRLSVAYHYAFKRLLGFPKHASNHFTCHLLDRMTFKHFYNLKVLKFFHWVTMSLSPCLIKFKYY